MAVDHLKALDLVVGAKPSPKRARKRWVNLGTEIKQARAAGLEVAGATRAPDGSVSLTFGNTATTMAENDIRTADNELAQWRRKKAQKNAHRG